MRVDPNSSVPDPLNVAPAKAKAPASAPELEANDFAASEKLTQALKNLPDVRADKVAAAKALVQDPAYPNDATLRQVASVLTEHIKGEKPA